jgi:cyclase
VTAPFTCEVADGIFAYIQPDGGWCVSNAGILAAGAAAVVIDTAATQARALLLRDAVQRVTASPVRLVLNTHHHGDHTFGNAVFPGAIVAAHDLTRTDMITRGTALRRAWPDVDWGDLDVVPPVLTFADRVTLHPGGARVEVCHVGPAHTTGDVVAWLPDQRVLFAGDVVMSGRTPFALMGSVAGSIAAIRWLRSLEPRTVVCGHGPVTGPGALELAEEYLTWVQRLAAQGQAAGLTPLETARQAGLGAYRDLAESERLVANLHRAYLEARGGQPGAYLPSAPVFAEMVAYNGGHPLACHA